MPISHFYVFVNFHILLLRNSKSNGNCLKCSWLMFDRGETLYWNCWKKKQMFFQCLNDDDFFLLQGTFWTVGLDFCTLRRWKKNSMKNVMNTSVYSVRTKRGWRMLINFKRMFLLNVSFRFDSILDGVLRNSDCGYRFMSFR